MTEYLTTAEVAALLRTSPSTVRYWRHRREGPPGVRVGRKVLYDRVDLEQWIADARKDEVPA